METGRRSSKRQKNKIPIYSTTEVKRRSITTLVDQSNNIGIKIIHFHQNGVKCHGR